MIVLTLSTFSHLLCHVLLEFCIAEPVLLAEDILLQILN